MDSANYAEVQAALKLAERALATISVYTGAGATTAEALHIRASLWRHQALLNTIREDCERPTDPPPIYRWRNA